MSLENFGSMLEAQDELPKLKEASKEDIQKIEESVKYSNKLIKVNNVLNVLDFPDNKEESFRKVLEQQDSRKLKELAWKSKKEILTFLVKQQSIKTDFKESNAVQTEQTENKKQTIEKEFQSKETQLIDSKITKIKWVLTSEILNDHPDIKQSFESFDLTESPKEKESILNGVLNLLKEPWVLKSIINNLWWANANNPKYREFKDSLIWIDSSFENYFNDLEKVDYSNSLNTSEIINSIEKESDWMLNIDLNSKSPISKLSLLWSNYSFDKEIDKQALWELMSDSNNKIEEIQNSSNVLKGLYSPLDNLIWNIRSNWWKEDFKNTLKSSVLNFPRDIFWDLNEVYENMDIKSEYRINESDINSFKDINSPDELKNKIENIKTKLSKIQTQIKEIQLWVLKEHKLWIKELVQRNKEEQEKQKEVLKFMKASWFDLIPKSITNKIVNELQSNMFIIPWLNLNINNIDLKNWHFGERWAFTSNEKWLSIESKVNMVKFVNKLISWDINEPLSVESISNWVWVANPSFLKSKFKEVWLVDGLGWKYSRIVENLRSKHIKKE